MTERGWGVLELSARLLKVIRADAQVAVATSIGVVGSAPHRVGTSMAVVAGGTVIGSVSAGCVEASAFTACCELLAGGPSRSMRFGFGEPDAARVGLACGGELDVLVHTVSGEAVEHELIAAAAGRRAAVGLVVAGPKSLLGAAIAGYEGAGLAGEPDSYALEGVSVERLRAAVIGQARSGHSGLVVVECGPLAIQLFVDVSAPAARMIIVGATETAVVLAALAAATGYAVAVCDHRAGFAAGDRFPAASEVVVTLPHQYLMATEVDEGTVVCLLSHDEDLDPLAVAVALERGAGYVGALGSRSTTARRRERLRALGVADGVAERLHAPIGLDIGASTPAETAVSILAEVLAVRTGGQGRRLATLSGPIHRPAGLT